MKANKNIGKIAYLIAIFGAVIIGILTYAGLITAGSTLTTLLVLAALVIGFLNISVKERQSIMLSALVIGGASGIFAALPFVGGLIDAILVHLAIVVLPIGLVVAITEVYQKAN